MSDALEKRVMRKISWRIIPFIMLLYFIAFLDRVNVGFAAIHMNEDVGLSPSIFGFGAGLFFIGYFLFEVPSNLALEKFGAFLKNEEMESIEIYGIHKYSADGFNDSSRRSDQINNAARMVNEDGQTCYVYARTSKAMADGVETND